MINKLVIIFLFIILIKYCAPNETGVKVRISKSGLTYAANLGIDLLVKEVYALGIPEASTSSYSLYNARITRFVKPIPSIAPIAGYGLSISLNNAAIDVGFKWKYKIGSGFFAIRDSGSGSATSKSLSISSSIKIGHDSYGKPTASTDSCSCSISGFNINVKAGLFSSLYNFIINFVEGEVKRGIQNSVCNSIKNIINTKGNKMVSSLNTEVMIDQIYLNYKLTENPVFTADYLETSHAGEFFTKSGIKYTQMTPPINFIANNGKMFSFVLTERLFNSGGYVLQKLGRFNKIFTTYNQEINGMLALGNDTILEIKMEAIEAPFVKIQTSSFVINSTANITFQKTEGVFITNLVVSLQLDASIYFEGDRIKGRVSSIRSDVSTIKGNFPLLTHKDNPANDLMTTAESDMSTIERNFAVVTQDDHFKGRPNTEKSLVFKIGGNFTKVTENDEPIRGRVSTVKSDESTLQGNFPAKLTQEQKLSDVLDGLFALLLPSLNDRAALGFPIAKLIGMNLVNPTLSLGQGFAKLESDF